MLRLGAATLLILLASAARTDAAPWRWPVAGDVIRAFEVRQSPFAPGQHRGIDIAAPLGTSVRAACAGAVAFAGAVGRSGRVVSIRCGELTATYLHLGSVAVRRGDRVRAGARLGTVGVSGRRSQRTPHLHLGARVTRRRWRYVDPLSLLPSPPGGAPVPVAPMLRRPTSMPHALRRPWRAPSGVAVPTVPLPAWLGIGLIMLGLPGWAARRARRRRRVAPRPAPEALRAR